MALKKFNDGDVFYSEDLDSLVAWSNMRFASAAARDAALVGNLAPAVGTNVTLADENRSYRRFSTMWLPQPGTVMFSAFSASTATIPAGGAVTIGGYTNLIRNFGNAFNLTNGQFTPPAQGYYEFCGGAAFSSPSNNGARTLYVGLGSGYNVTGSSYSYEYGHALYSIFSPAVILLGIGTVAYLNVFNGGSPSTQTLNPDGNSPAYFSAKYLGQ